MKRFLLLPLKIAAGFLTAITAGLGIALAGARLGNELILTLGSFIMLTGGFVALPVIVFDHVTGGDYSWPSVKRALSAGLSWGIRLLVVGLVLFAGYVLGPPDYERLLTTGDLAHDGKSLLLAVVAAAALAPLMIRFSRRHLQKALTLIEGVASDVRHAYHTSGTREGVMTSHSTFFTLDGRAMEMAKEAYVCSGDQVIAAARPRRNGVWQVLALRNLSKGVSARRHLHPLSGVADTRVRERLQQAEMKPRTTA